MSEDSIIAGQSFGNLNFSTAQKMINRLLTHDRIRTKLYEGRIRGRSPYNESEIKIRAFNKKELAEKFGINLEEFDKLKSPDFYSSMASKISLPLIRLYCATKFVDGEYKGG